MKKAITLILVVFISIIISVAYGIIHNYITYTISPEFYTKDIFFKFGVLDDYSRKFSGSWTLALIWIGFFSTWWFGLLIGLIFIIPSINNTKLKLTTFLKSILIIIGFVILFGFIGYIVAELHPSEIISNYNYPFEIENKRNFNKVHTINSFSYIGGIMGVIIGILFLLKSRDRKVIN
jgi:hypothetical protein